MDDGACYVRGSRMKMEVRPLGVLFPELKREGKAKHRNFSKGEGWAEMMWLSRIVVGIHSGVGHGLSISEFQPPGLMTIVSDVFQRKV
jgi:hypothetical protein